MACGLALLASGQAFATEYYSAGNIGDGDLTNGTKWVLGSTSCGSGGTPGTGTIAMVAADLLIVCPGHSLNLTTAATVAADMLIFEPGTPGGAWGGVRLKFSTSSTKRIINNNASLSSIALDISSMTDGDEITIASMGLGQSVTFSGITGGSLSCATSYPATITVGTVCTVTVVTGGGGTVSAPIFSTKEKPAVFSEEVK